MQVILQQAYGAWAPAHPFPSTADLAALHTKANWPTVPVAVAAVAPRYHALLALKSSRRSKSKRAGERRAYVIIVARRDELPRMRSLQSPTGSRRPRVCGAAAIDEPEAAV